MKSAKLKPTGFEISVPAFVEMEIKSKWILEQTKRR